MPRLDHLALNVHSVEQCRDWYTSVLHLEVEFEVTGPPIVLGLKDDADFTLILSQGDRAPSDCSLFFQVRDVESTHRDLAERGVAFLYGPRLNDWGYGAGLHDPDGRFVGLWDETSMREHMSSTE
jgi:catechol 2,3-dioxygenase-like lactoylglutathione lyase family enzyme